MNAVTSFLDLSQTYGPEQLLPPDPKAGQMGMNNITLREHRVSRDIVKPIVTEVNFIGSKSIRVNFFR